MENLPNNNLMMVLPETEKLEFVRKSVSWIQGHDIMDTCFILNFGYEAPLPWPQVNVKSHVYNVHEEMRIPLQI